MSGSRDVSKPGADVVHALVDAHNGGDVEALRSLCHPELELRPVNELLGRQVEYHGHDGIREYLLDLRETWTEFAVELSAVEDLGDRRFLGVASQRGRGKGSGVEVSDSLAFVIELENGKILRILGYMDEAEARRDLQRS